MSRAARFFLPLVFTLATAPPALSESPLTLPPSPPAEALRKFQLEPGLRIELAAAEPQVADPVALCWDENGALFVAEMRDYPYGYRPEEPPLSRVRRLEDRDGDGRYETSTVFAEKLHWATAVAPWKGGVFVIAPPEILYLRDTDGDGVADERRTVFTGVGTKSAEDVMNGLAWGLDHRLYGVPSYSGGEVRSAARPRDAAQRVGGHDFRIDPARGTFELIEGGEADFGQGFDDWGRRFTTHMNTIALHPWLPLRYAARQPHLTGLRATRDLARLGGNNAVFQISAPEPWRVVRQASWSRFVNTSHDLRADRFGGTELEPRGFVTSAAGLAVFRGTALPEEYRGDIFTGEPACNAVIRTRLRADGAGFIAERLPGARAEFLASTDNWFRPVNLANGPDGALYVADMYRAVIEDPSAIPPELLRQLDLRLGNDLGRIWRVVGEKTPRETRRPALGRATAEGLVAELENASAWWRETAHRLLFERQDSTAIEPLRRLLRTGTRPQARLHALWSLQGLGALDEAGLLAAAGDAHPAVRAAALALAEPWLPPSPDLRAALAAAVHDTDPGVRLQALFSAGELPPAARQPFLEAAARQLGTDPSLRTAWLTSTAGLEAKLAGALLHAETDADLLAGLARILGTRGNAAEVRAWMAALTDARATLPAALLARAVTGLAEGVKISGLTATAGDHQALAAFRTHADPAVQRAALALDAAFTAPATVAAAPAPEPPADAAARAREWAELKSALALPGVAARGREIFATRCAACHRAGGTGAEVGPDMNTVGHHSAEQILQSIIDPSREVSPNFLQQLIETQTGEQLTGILGSQDAASLTLRLPGGSERTVLRRHLRRQTESKTSLMPPGLLVGCTPQQVADLLAFLRPAEPAKSGPP